jgi:hypothetical protein
MEATNTNPNPVAGMRCLCVDVIVQTTLNISFYNCVARLAPRDYVTVGIESFGVVLKAQQVRQQGWAVCHLPMGRPIDDMFKPPTISRAYMRTPYRHDDVCVAHRWKYHVC